MVLKVGIALKIVRHGKPVCLSDVTLSMALDVTLDTTLDMNLGVTLDMTPNIAMEMTLDTALDMNLGVTLDMTPSITLEMTLDLTLDMTPNITLEKTHDTTLDMTLDISLPCYATQLLGMWLGRMPAALNFPAPWHGFMRVFMSFILPIISDELPDVKLRFICCEEGTWLPTLPRRGSGWHLSCMVIENAPLKY